MLSNETGNGIIPLFCAKGFQNGKSGFADSVVGVRAVRRQVRLKGVVVCHFGLHKLVQHLTADGFARVGLVFLLITFSHKGHNLIGYTATDALRLLPRIIRSQPRQSQQCECGHVVLLGRGQAQCLQHLLCFGYLLIHASPYPLCCFLRPVPSPTHLSCRYCPASIARACPMP